jgi:hypothetical protein
VGSLERRLEVLEGQSSPTRGASLDARRAAARERIRAVLDEIAAARREGREPSEEASVVSEAIERRRARES